MIVSEHETTRFRRMSDEGNTLINISVHVRLSETNTSVTARAIYRTKILRSDLFFNHKVT